MMRKALSQYFQIFSNKIDLFFEAKSNQYPIQSNIKRTDSFESELDQYITNLEKLVNENGSVLPVTPAKSVVSFSGSQVITAIMNEIKTWNEKELENYFNKRLGKILPYTDDWWNIILPRWRDTLATRASGTIITYLERVKEIVLEGVFNKTPIDQVAKKIKALSKSLTDARATFLARDLTGTYNSLALQQIHTNILGLPYYSWATALDERVRGRPGGVYPKAVPSHWDMQNKVCKWTDSSVYSPDRGKTWEPRTERMTKVHPGIDWQCRCTAIPYDLDFILSVDKRIGLSGKK
jgi:hypothetical protein